MSSVDQNQDSVTPGGNAVKARLQTAVNRYGLGTLFAANVLGAGSVYILAQTGANVGFALLWVLPIAFALDMVMHDLSGRMAARGQPLMTYIRNKTGERQAVAYALTMALVMQLWAVANYAVAGYSLAWFIGGDPLALVLACAMVAIILLLTGTYRQIESIIAGMIVFVFAAYASMVIGTGAPLGEVGRGFIPGGVSDATLVIAILGTTVYYPNFFIQSSMRPTKGWTSLKKWRRDNAVGVGFSVLVSAGMMILAAVTLSSGELTLTAPAIPIVDMAGSWALPLFMFAVFAASFTSATGTLFGSGFAVPQSFGLETKFGDEAFTTTTICLIAISAVISIALLTYTEMTPVRMAITMPAVNGIIYLPLTLIAMCAANWSHIGVKQKIVTVAAIGVLLIGSALTAQSLADTITGWL